TAESQSLKPYKLMEPPTDTWPMYNGDYSGRRFSTLNRINDSNISSLSLAWVYRVNVSGGGFGGSIKATPLLVDGVLYFTLPDHAWAIDARTGREVWHFAWESEGGIHIGSRGAAAYGNWLYFETPDCNLEIGRASCREREESTVRPGPRKQKSANQHSTAQPKKPDQRQSHQTL